MSDEKTRLRILRIIAERPDGAISADLTGVFGRDLPRQRAQSWVCNHLRLLARDGQIAQDGKRYQHAGNRPMPSPVWKITERGHAVIRYADDAPAREAQERAAQVALLEAAERRARCLGEAQRRYGRNTPPETRRIAAKELRALGCTLDEIGAIFEVSREMIRKDVLRDHPYQSSGLRHISPKPTVRERTRALHAVIERLLGDHAADGGEFAELADAYRQLTGWQASS